MHLPNYIVARKWDNREYKRVDFKFDEEIKNKKGETALDRSINNNYICTAFKLLGDKKYNNIDVSQFRNLFNACIKSKYYGKYSKINNLEIIIENLEKKDLSPNLRRIVDNISDNFDLIKNDIMNNNHSILDTIIDYSSDEVIA